MTLKTEADKDIVALIGARLRCFIQPRIGQLGLLDFLSYFELVDRASERLLACVMLVEHVTNFLEGPEFEETSSGVAGIPPILTYM